MPIPADQLEEYVINFAKELLDSPIAVYNHQLKLKSTQAAVKKLAERKDEVTKLLNAVPFRKERLKEQHEMGIIDSGSLSKQIEELNNKASDYKEALLSIEENIAQSELSEQYELTLELFSKKYRSTLDDVFSKRDEISDILHTLIDKIIVYSRPVGTDDVVAGKKKYDQYMPNNLEIKLRLPKDIMLQVAFRFRVELADL